MRCTYILLDIYSVAVSLRFWFSWRQTSDEYHAARRMPYLCHSGSATRNRIEKLHRQPGAAWVNVAVCFYDSYEMAVIVAIAPEKVELLL